MINKITSKDLSSYDIFKDDKIKKEHYNQNSNNKNKQKKELVFLKELRKAIVDKEKNTAVKKSKTNK